MSLPNVRGTQTSPTTCFYHNSGVKRVRGALIDKEIPRPPVPSHLLVRIQYSLVAISIIEVLLRDLLSFFRSGHDSICVSRRHCSRVPSCHLIDAAQ